MRVIAGRLGGRTLHAPRGLSTRPTTDRVREALFSMLGDVEGARVLDLYAGTGALAIEALSRGAMSATLVEDARPALSALRRNLASLGLDGVARVVAEPVGRAAPRLASSARSGGDRFDLVLADPPYDDVDAALAALEVLVPALAPGARVVLEHAARRPPRASEILATLRSRAHGDTALTFLAARTDEITPPDQADGHEPRSR